MPGADPPHPVADGWPTGRLRRTRRRRQQQYAYYQQMLVEYREYLATLRRTEDVPIRAVTDSGDPVL